MPGERPAEGAREDRPARRVSPRRTPARRMSPRRVARRAARAVVVASLVIPVAGAARAPAVPAPVPAALPPLPAATPDVLADRYAATRREVLRAGGMAAEHGHHRRAASLRAMADPARRFLSFDGRDGGRTAEVFGDLSRAGRIAVLVPGADTDLDRYGRFRAGATALQQRVTRQDGAAAVIAWLGYRTPSTYGFAALTAGLAGEAAPGLRRFVRELGALRPGARISLVCHSYGSVVCARAASEPGIADVVLYGSPGTGASHAAELRTEAAVWAGRGAGDWISAVPHTRVPLPFATLGFGTDPVSPAFGARVFPAGGGGHSDYLRPGSVALESIARIVLARPPAGDHG